MLFFFIHFFVHYYRWLISQLFEKAFNEARSLEFANLPSVSRADTFLSQNLSSYTDLWNFCKKLLLLSHGQAEVERGFSINKEVETCNMSEETLSELLFKGSSVIKWKFVGGDKSASSKRANQLVCLSTDPLLGTLGRGKKEDWDRRKLQEKKVCWIGSERAQAKETINLRNLQIFGEWCR